MSLYLGLFVSTRNRLSLLLDMRMEMQSNLISRFNNNLYNFNNFTMSGITFESMDIPVNENEININ